MGLVGFAFVLLGFYMKFGSVFIWFSLGLAFKRMKIGFTGLYWALLKLVIGGFRR